MSIICPAVLAATPDEYREQLEAVAPFATRIQIDLGDGIFTSQLIDVADVWWPETISPDIHVMYQRPLSILPSLIALQPDMIILHAESDEVQDALDHVREHGIRTGIALLPDTQVESVRELIRRVDHVLLFAGSLGQQGGAADLSQLRKVGQIRAIRSDVEVGWDGGANQDNVRVLSSGGVDVIDVGSAIQKANHPENAYRALVRQLLALTDA